MHARKQDKETAQRGVQKVFQVLIILIGVEFEVQNYSRLVC